MIKVFLSYSHRDEDLRNELEIHLSMLKRQGVIETWHDRRIGAGKDIDSSIDANLETANIILLLVSPYFISSDYCYEKEMMRALERHEAGEARVIPVILHPCDWQHAPFGKLRATPPDGKPVSKFSNIHDAFFAVVKDVRAAAVELEGSTSKAETAVVDRRPVEDRPSAVAPRSSNLGIRKEFNDFEKSKFLADSFEYFSNFFENSLTELKNRVAGIDTEFKRIDRNHFTAGIYQNGKMISRCKVWLAEEAYSRGDIRYSASFTPDNSWNESVSVADDGHILGLKALGMASFSGGDSLMTQEGAAELYWSLFIERLQ